MIPNMLRWTIIDITSNSVLFPRSVGQAVEDPDQSVEKGREVVREIGWCMLTRVSTEEPILVRLHSKERKSLLEGIKSSTKLR